MTRTLARRAIASVTPAPAPAGGAAPVTLQPREPPTRVVRDNL